MTSLKKAVVIAAALSLAFLSTGCQKLRARDNLNKGVAAYKGLKYPDAAEYFKTAVELDPEFPTARLYLATAYMSQWIPGAESEENKKMAQAAYDEFQNVLKQDDKNTVAIASIASMLFNQKKLDEAKGWYDRLLAADPQNKEAYYTLGVIAWTKTFQVRMEARAKLGMKAEEPPPIKDKKVREEVKEKNLAIIEDGIKNLQKSLDVDKEYDDAMAYMNLMHRERADLADNKDDAKKDTDIADSWVEKTLVTKKMKQARADAKAAAGGIVQESK